MWFFMALALLCSLWMPLDLLKTLASLANLFHHHCLTWIPQSSSYAGLYGAMVCGAALQDAGLESKLRQTALIHLIVVSGAHLVLIEQTLLYVERHLNLPRWAIDILLWGYGFVTLLNPPIMRALLQRSLQRLSRRWELHWPSSTVIVASGAFGLLLFPAWWTSLSFQLSLMASMGLEYARILKKSEHVLVYLLVVPLLLRLHAPHPASILINAALAPVFGLVLLPVSWMGLLVHQLTPLTDKVWSLFITVITFLAEILPSWTQQPAPLTAVGEWAYIAFVLVLVFFLERQTLQKNLCFTN